MTLNHLVLMFGAVVFGSVFPVLPNGAAVSVAVVSTGLSHPLALAVVILASAVGAWIGDVITYAFMVLVSRSSSDGRSRWIKRDTTAQRIDRMRTHIDRNDIWVLTLSRLIPAGRLPVLVAASMGGYPFRRYLVADLPACLVWAVMYAFVGLGSGLFPNKWVGTIVAILVVVGISLLGRFVRKPQA